jgi:hypothetical protein
LTEEEMDDVAEIARHRNQSYQDGRTHDTNYTSDSGEKVHNTGIMAEKAVSVLYREAYVDREVSAKGDGGVDCRIYIDDELRTVDVKASTYSNVWLQLKKNASHAGTDIFAIAYVDTDKNRVELVGYAWHDELVQDENLEDSFASGSSHMNYVQKNDFNVLPKPNTDRDYFSW